MRISWPASPQHTKHHDPGVYKRSERILTARLMTEISNCSITGRTQSLPQFLKPFWSVSTARAAGLLVLHRAEEYERA
jgi:hypothetical protein